MESSVSVDPQHQPGLLRNRAFLLVLGGMAVSQLGTSLYQMVAPVWVIQTTGSAGSIAAMTGISTVIRLLAAPVAGTVADRSDRRLVMASASLAQALIVSSLAAAFWSGFDPFRLLLIGSASLALAGAFFSPAYAAAQTGLVHPQDLTRALTIWQMVRQTIALVGPAAAGVVVTAFGPAWALAANGVTYLVSALCVLVIRLHWAPAPVRDRRPFWRDFADGLTVITGSPIVRRTVILGAGVNLAGSAFAVLLPVIALREMGLSPAVYGLFQVVNPSGIMAGMVALTAFAHRITRRGRFMLHALLLMGLSNVAMGWTTRSAFFLMLLFAGGVLFGLQNVLFADLWRRLVPQEQQGRFFGMQGSLNQALAPVGMAAAGFLADRFSPYHIAGGAGLLVVALAVWGLMGPGLRSIR